LRIALACSSKRGTRFKKPRAKEHKQNAIEANGAIMGRGFGVLLK
jgi:hypothetical protein